MGISETDRAADAARQVRASGITCIARNKTNQHLVHQAQITSGNNGGGPWSTQMAINTCNHSGVSPLKELQKVGSRG